MKEYISIKDLNFSYNKEKFITDLDFDIPKSTSIGLIGPSGSGKTTIIKLILGLLSPQKGSIKINKKIIAANIVWVTRRRRETSNMFECL